MSLPPWPTLTANEWRQRVAEMRARRAMHAEDRALYSPDQPRVPKGSGEESGQWTAGDGTAAATRWSAAYGRLKAKLAGTARQLEADLDKAERAYEAFLRSENPYEGVHITDEDRARFQGDPEGFGRWVAETFLRPREKPYEDAVAAAKQAIADHLVAADRAYAKLEDRALAALAVPQSNNVSVGAISPKLEDVADRIRTAVPKLERLYAGGTAVVVDDIRPMSRRDTFLGNTGEYQLAGRVIRIDPEYAVDLRDDFEANLFHEFGHAIEHTLPAANKAAQGMVAFMESREFNRSYAAKQYPNGMTEVVSTGVEAYATRPARMAATAPRHFAFIYDVMHGAYAPKRGRR